MYKRQGYTYGVEISSDGNTAYVADGSSGLALVDIATPATPSLLGSYNTAGNALGVQVSSDGNTAYVADSSNGLVLIDITNPAAPFEK